MPRISDIYAALPAMTGKMELEYEGEQIGKSPCKGPYQTGLRCDFGRIFPWYRFRPGGSMVEEGNKLLSSDTASADECVLLLDSVPDLIESTLVPLEFGKKEKGKLVSACEFVLEGL